MLGGVTVARRGARRDRALDRRDVVGGQREIGGGERLGEPVAATRADHRHDVLALRHDPGDRDLRDARVPFLSDRAERFDQREVPVEVLALESRAVSAEIARLRAGLVEATAEDRFVDMLAEGCEAGVRYEERLALDMIAAPIGPRRQRFAVAAAPSYLAARGTPGHPRDLLGHARIGHRFAGSRALAIWEFECEGEVFRIPPKGPLTATTFEIQIAAATAGLGIICHFEEALADELASGALAPVLQEWRQDFSGPQLYYQSRRHMPPPLRAFVDFVKSRPWG